MNKEGFLVTTSAADAQTIQVTLEGHLVIRNAVAIKNELMAPLAGPQNVYLVLRNVIKLDLAVLQLLLAFQKSADTPAKNVRYNLALPEKIQSLLEYTGLANKLTAYPQITG